MSEKEKSSLIDQFVEAIGDAVSTVVDNVETFLSQSEKTEKTEPAGETVKESENSIDDQNEVRVGYASASAAALPQGEEPEIEAAIEPDDKNKVETAIAAARETARESAAEIKDPLVAETLPALPRVDQAKLYLQSPNRIFAYWSVAGNPYATLQKALGRRADAYQLVSKLVNLDTNAESFAPADFSGSWWFNVRSNSRYVVEIGFYQANRPFVRLLSSNQVLTPRANPSPRRATDADWIVSTKQFAEVLTSSGYSHDVFDVVFNTDQETGESSDNTSTLAAANRFAALTAEDLDLSELRRALVALAAGVDLNDLRPNFSHALAAWVDSVLATDYAALESPNVRQVLASIFGNEFVEAIGDETEFIYQRLAPVAVGASAINFPEIRFPKLSKSKLEQLKNPFAKTDFPIGAEVVSSHEFLN